MVKPTVKMLSLLRDKRNSGFMKDNGLLVVKKIKLN